MIKNTFTKTERLTNKKTLEIIFNSGKTISIFPFRLIWIKTKAIPLFPVQIAISVPKKSFAKAIDRNKIKRKIRESFRKNKHLFYTILKKTNLHIALMVIYIAKEELPYHEIEKKMIVSLHKLMKENNN